MRALLLAAGFGTRLRPLTDTIPKCLAPIHGRPLLDYWLDTLFAGDAIERVVVNTHYLAPLVVAHIAASPWKALIDIVHEPELLGTGGTIVVNRSSLGPGPALVAHADNLTDLDLPAFQTFHARRPPHTLMSMLAFRTDAPKTCGILELDSAGVVSAFHEKVANPPGNLANAAVYILEPAVIEMTAAIGKAFVDLSTEVLPQLMGRIAVMETRGYHRDIGSLESLARAHQEFQPKSRGP
jgi:mannose-1-phosphate guanylyltransferase